MARIRSLHPGQWTDEDFVSCSAFARLLALGLRNEADDQGVFEWKPVGLKMRLFPVDNLDIVSLLAELVEHDQIKQYENGSKKYGVIRNFGKYQRPKKPNAVHPISDEFRIYAALNVSGSEPDDDEAPPVPKKSELPPQMKEEGGKGKGSRVSNETLSPSPDSESEEFSDFVKAYPKAEGRNAAITEWNAAVEAGATPESILAGLASAKKVWAKEKREERWIKNAGTWLADRGWLDHAPDVAPMKPWDGPEPVRKAILAAIGPDAAKSCFDHSEWDGEQIIPRTTWVFDKLRGVPGVKDMLAPVRKVA